REIHSEARILPMRLAARIVGGGIGVLMGWVGRPTLPEIVPCGLASPLAGAVTRALCGSVAPIVMRWLWGLIVVRLGVVVLRSILTARGRLRLGRLPRRPSLTLVAAPQLGEWIALPDQPGKLGEGIAGARGFVRPRRLGRSPMWIIRAI